MRVSLTIDQAADRVGVTRRTINRWIASGDLPCVAFKGVRYVYLPSLLRCERERRNARKPGRPGARVPVAT